MSKETKKKKVEEEKVEEEKKERKIVDKNWGYGYLRGNIDGSFNSIIEFAELSKTMCNPSIQYGTILNFYMLIRIRSVMISSILSQMNIRTKISNSSYIRIS